MIDDFVTRVVNDDQFAFHQNDSNIVCTSNNSIELVNLIDQHEILHSR